MWQTLPPKIGGYVLRQTHIESATGQQQVIRLQASVEVRSTSPHGLSISWSAALEAPEGYIVGFHWKIRISGFGQSDSQTLFFLEQRLFFPLF
jgi:hypothetical protein